VSTIILGAFIATCAIVCLALAVDVALEAETLREYLGAAACLFVAIVLLAVLSR
jgi:hypothetical protein